MYTELALTQAWDRTPLDAREATTSLRLSSTSEDLLVEVDAPRWGDPPPDGAPGPTEGLWDYEVVELFIAGEDGYLELELGPHGHHLLIRFRDIRVPVARGLAIPYRAEPRGSRWYGVAQVPRYLLPAGPLSANLCAIHGTAPRRFLTAATLSGDRPNFHQPESFFPLELPRQI
ncbi:MAG: hypothetical protein JXX28_16885 [Deltaproteobacteria bacterium]|nr:hypothetical protein [Deltaproteobacteria bacterium]